MPKDYGQTCPVAPSLAFLGERCPDSDDLVGADQVTRRPAPARKKESLK